ncbi:MAG: hypothetical protein BWY71_02348 [Planctomycetes bacterium ADurb.Bin412]|nr:MAG: hypothetical protein BWY71_02348 [Planctomycetes bacterium ADurb.Bin412]
MPFQDDGPGIHPAIQLGHSNHTAAEGNAAHCQGQTPNESRKAGEGFRRITEYHQRHQCGGSPAEAIQQTHQLGHLNHSNRISQQEAQDGPCRQREPQDFEGNDIPAKERSRNSSQQADGSQQISPAGRPG